MLLALSLSIALRLVDIPTETVWAIRLMSAFGHGTALRGFLVAGFPEQVPRNDGNYDT
jgi:hypothetical protein